MELILSPTEKIVTIRVNGTDVPARVWQGKTATGIPCHCYITRVAVAEDRPAHELAEFDQALQPVEKMRPDVEAIPLRFIL